MGEAPRPADPCQLPPRRMTGHSWLAQLALDLGLRVRSRGPRGLGLGLAADTLRRLLVRLSDPLVWLSVSGTDLELPLSHQLPIHQLLLPQYGMNVGRLAAAVEAAHPGATIVDVGANVGDTAAIIRAASRSPILCVEGDARFFEILRSNAARMREVFVEQAFVGGTDGTAPVTSSSRAGTTRLVGGGTGIVELETLGRILSRWPALPAPALVKIDTDGFDCPIIEGARDVWERYRPVLLFEYDPAFLPDDFRPASFFEGLARLGYERLMVYENTGDFLVAVDVKQRSALVDLHHFYRGRNSGRYADIAAFHRDDGELAEHFRRTELEHFERVRCGA